MTLYTRYFENTGYIGSYLKFGQMDNVFDELKFGQEFGQMA
jgi:hypothetical protein